MLNAENIDVLDRLALLLTATPLASKPSVGALDKFGNTALHYAASRGNSATVAALLRHGANVNARNAKGLSVLWQATAGGHVEIIQQLLERGALVIPEKEYGRSPFHLAMLNGDLAAVNCFISLRGQKDNIRSVVTDIDPMFKDTLLHCAAQNGSRPIIELCIEGGEAVSGRDFFGMTPLLVAAQYGQLGAVNCLLEKGAKLEEEDRKTKDRAVHYAAKEGHTKLLASLISRSADINYCGWRTPLGYAVRNGHLAAAQLLVSSGAHVQQEFLCSAAKTGNVEMLELLLENGLLIDEYDSDGTPLQVAAGCGHEGAVGFLIKRGAQIEGDSFHMNALHKASQRGHVPVIKLLLDAGAEINAGSRRTPLVYASIEGHLGAVEYLIERGASLTKNSMLVLDQVLIGSAERSCAFGTPQCIKALIGAGSSISQDSMAYAIAHLEIMRMLVNLRPSCMADLLLDEHKDVLLKIPEVIRNGIKEYLNKREFYLQHGFFQEGDNPKLMFKVAAYFLDLRLLEVFKNHWRDKIRLWRGAQEENMLMAALRTLNVQARRWLLEEELCFIHHRDSNEQNALSVAIMQRDMLLINELLYGGAKIRAEHLALASSCGNREILTKLAVIYYYTWRETKPIGWNLWR